MRAKVGAVSNSIRLSLCPLLQPLQQPLLSCTSFLPKALILNSCLFSSSTSSRSSLSSEAIEQVVKDLKGPTKLFRGCGCSDVEISKIFLRQPSLIKCDLTILESKLNLLRGMGLTGSDLVKIINCRPRLLACRIGQDLDERTSFLENLFGSKELLLKAIIRNPSLLNYDLQKHIKSSVSIYEEMGIKREELVPMLISRPTIIPRTSLDDDKLEYIRRIGISQDSKMYKYVVTLIAISRLQTIHEKVANLEKFGFSGDEVMGLFARSPLVFTLSVDKVQRNMTFIIGIMRLPPNNILQFPFLLYANLENVLRPRFRLAEEIGKLDLNPQIKGAAMLRALRMTEARFLKAFVECHVEDVRNRLMEIYRDAKGIQKLAATSRRTINQGFPF